MFKYIVKNIKTEQNLKKYIESLGLSGSKVNKLFQMNCCYVNRTIESSNYIVKENDFIELDTSIFETMRYRPIEFNLTVLYEDENLIVIEKPFGNIVYDPEDKIPSMCNYLSYYYKQNKKKIEIYPVHRLDTDTSGCLVFGKDIITASSLSKMFENKVVTKKYVALVQGVVEREGTINKNIGTDRHINNKMVIYPKGKIAITKYKLLSTNEKTSLVEAMPITGRTHQIRVHLASIGNPLVGDVLYGSKYQNERIMLHCQSISFKHPLKDKNITVYSPLPDEFKLR